MQLRDFACLRPHCLFHLTPPISRCACSLRSLATQSISCLIALPMLARLQEGDACCLSRNFACRAASLSCFGHIHITLNWRFCDHSSNWARTRLGRNRPWFVACCVLPITCAYCRCRGRPCSIVQGYWMCHFGLSSMLEIKCQSPLFTRCRGC